MASTMMMERTGMGMPGMLGAAGLGSPGLGGAGTQAAGTNYVMVPRCTLKVEKVTGGLRLCCTGTDQMAGAMIQQLCSALTGGLCSYTVQLNGLTVCCCNLTMGLCKTENSKDGVTVTCTSGDAKCGQMIQACCESLQAMLQAGCICCVNLNNMPICCGTAQ